MASKPSQNQLQKCMRHPECVRNVCILAHVDHGKTTVADSLLATNRLVSKRLAGTLRYLDDRSDEQERKITMKSSAVSLLNALHDSDSNTNYLLLLNVIDTPGHIDFSSEVTAAVRVSDGAIILVDVAEGVCVQTKESIKQAFEQRAKMILVLNKLDRLFVNKDVDEIFLCISQIIENCNAVVAELYQYTESEIDIEKTDLLFHPEKGNVIFASAIHGWGFTLKHIAAMFTKILPNETVDSLNEKLWNFDYYIDANSKSIKSGAIEKRKTNVFTQLCLKTLKYIYYTIVVRMEREKVDHILDKLNIKTITRDMKHNDIKIQIKAILEAWNPLAETILQQCHKIIPPPCAIPLEKIKYLLNQHFFCEEPYLNECIENLIPHFEKCSSNDEAPVVLYVSKMFCVHKSNLSQNKPKAFVLKSPEELQELRNKEEQKLDSDDSEEVKEEERDIVTVALARVFTGNLKIGDEVYVLHPGYTPDKNKIEENINEFIENNKNITKATVKELYMLFGRELLLVDNIPAGNICAIAGLESAVLRTATVSNTVKCVPFVEQQPQEPIVRNVIEPVNLAELPILRRGLKDLLQSDSCLKVLTQETGELVLLTAGSVHLEKCLEDLRNKFAKIEINVYSPMVSLRETILYETSKYDPKNEESKIVTLTSGPFTVSVVAVCVPEYISDLIKRNYNLLRMIEEHSSQDEDESNEFGEKKFKSQNLNLAISKIKENIKKTFSKKKNFWMTLYDKIWSVGAMNDNINLLINGTEDYKCDIFTKAPKTDNRSSYDFCITNTFKLACKSGPLCEEPIMNCAFIVTKYEFNSDLIENNLLNTASVQLQLKSLFREALEKRPLRLMEPIFTTDVQVNTSILGKVYTVISKRHGKVLDAVGMDEEEKKYLVKAQLPVIESVGFADEIRKMTSGQALPNLKFSHYEIINGDPLYEPVSDDEDEEDIDVESAVRASKLRKELRRKKGLSVDDQVVMHADLWK